MPTISFVSPKGGTGKTTSALILATQIARSAPVTVIDADPNRPIHTWASAQPNLKNFSVISDANEENILDLIEEAASRTPFVICDLEGTASRIVVMSVSHSDFVIVPSQGSQLDAAQAGRALKVIQQAEKMVRRSNPSFSLPHAILLTRTNAAIRSRTLTFIEKSFTDAGIPVLNTELNERDAFKAMISFQLPLEQLDQNEVSNVDKAIKNAESFAAEVVEILRQRRTA